MLYCRWNANNAELIYPEEITFVVKNTYDRVAFEYSMLKMVSILLGSIIMYKLPFNANYYFLCLKKVLLSLFCYLKHFFPLCC